MADNFKIIGITTPAPLYSPSEEARIIVEFLESRAIDYFHIRKPGASEDYARGLLNAIPRFLFSRLVIHSHYHLFHDFPSAGFHLKTGVNAPQTVSFLTRSCHSVRECKEESSSFAYSFLSPIFDSISKEGYISAFSLNDSELLQTLRQVPVVALGGVTPAHFQNLFKIKFAGAALLGYLWSPKSSLDATISDLLKAKEKLY